MKMAPVEQCVGMTLCHDITWISPGEGKGRAFRRGHVVRLEDVPRLLDIGKAHLYVWDPQDGFVHEDDAARRLAQAVAGPGLSLTEPCEGRINLAAEMDGLLKIDVEGLREVNAIEEVVVASIHGDMPVSAGRLVAGTRVIPLVVVEDKVARVEKLCRERGPLARVLPFRPLKVGVVTTGGEVYHGRIKDKFGPILKRKFADLNCTVMRQIITPDDVPTTVRAIRELLAEGAEMIAVTGGMSVDPDDRTPSAIRAAGGQIVSYGAPTFPGAMFMLAYIGDAPIMGLPGCVMYHQASIFDLIAPRLVAGERLRREDVVGLGHGGFCANCPECRFPLCGFGKR